MKPEKVALILSLIFAVFAMFYDFSDANERFCFVYPELCDLFHPIADR